MLGSAKVVRGDVYQSQNFYSDGYYYIKNKTKDDRIYLKCKYFRKYKCRASARLLSAGEDYSFETLRSHHTHPRKYSLDKAPLKEVAKEETVTGNHTHLSEVFDKICSETEETYPVDVMKYEICEEESMLADDSDSGNQSLVSVSILCRVCATQCQAGRCVSLNPPPAQLAAHLQIFFDIQIIEGDGMPTQMCAECITAITDWVSMCQKVETAQQLLKTIVSDPLALDTTVSGQKKHSAVKTKTRKCKKYGKNKPITSKSVVTSKKCKHTLPKSTQLNGESLSSDQTNKNDLEKNQSLPSTSATDPFKSNNVTLHTSEHTHSNLTPCTTFESITIKTEREFISEESDTNNTSVINKSIQNQSSTVDTKVEPNDCIQLQTNSLQNLTACSMSTSSAVVTPITSRIFLQTNLNNTNVSLLQIRPSLAPLQPSLAPLQRTLAPSKPTLAPLQPSLVPLQQTLTPSQPTLAPIQPTLAPLQPLLKPSPVTKNVSTRYSKWDATKDFPCGICELNLYTYGEFKKHLEFELSKLRNKVLPCVFCKLRFKKVNLLLEHHMRHARDTSDPVLARSSFQCKTCSKRFRNNYDYRQHLLTHEDHKTFICLVCGQGYKHRASWTRHFTINHKSTANFNESLRIVPFPSE